MVKQAIESGEEDIIVGKSNEDNMSIEREAMKPEMDETIKGYASKVILLESLEDISICKK